MTPMKRVISGMHLLALTCGTAAAEDKLFSGPQPGEKIAPFKVVQVSGPQTAKDVEIAGAATTGPMLLVFAHTINEPALGQMMELEWYVSKQEGLSGHYILLTDDRSKTEETAKRWWQTPFFSEAPMSISVDGLEGPGSYGLNRNVDMTVLLVNENKVVANLALLGANSVQSSKILAEVAKVMGTPVPSIDKIREEVRADRQRKRTGPLQRDRVFKLAPDAQLGELMVLMLYRENNTEAYIQEAADDILAWAGDDAKRKADVVKYCKSILAGEFDYSQDAAKTLKKIAGIR